MLDNKEIWRSALLMVTRYGEEAEAECEKRAEELATGSDFEGAATWRLMAVAARQLADVQAPPREWLN